MLGAIALTTDNLTKLVIEAANRYSVDPALVMAHIKAESSWNPSAYRPEPQINDASWGLMQVLLATAKKVSGNNKLTASELLKPETNIDIGTKYIAQQIQRYSGNIKDAIAAYNAGSARRKFDGSYINQPYVDRVYGYFLMYRGTQALKTPLGMAALVSIAVGTVLGFLWIRK